MRRATGGDATAAAALVGASRYHRLDLDDPANVRTFLLDQATRSAATTIEGSHYTEVIG